MEISFDELFKMDSPNIIDIRSLEKYNDNHIPSAINVNYNELMSNPGKYLKKGFNYYIYCQRGITSKRVTEILRLYGYNVYSIIGGYEAYVLN